MTARSGRGLVAAALFASGATACDGSLRFAPLDASSPTDDGGARDGEAPDAGTPEASGPFVCGPGAACGLATLRCDTASARCVECLASADCKDTARPRCDTATHRCVACLARADCTGGREDCEATTHTCVRTCDENDECPSLRCDRARLRCIECATSQECATSTAGPVCDVTLGRCARCVEDATCPPRTPHCDRASGTCVGCLAPEHCAGATPLCDPQARACVRAP